MDFSIIKALTIPEGEVTKIEANGVVLWQVITETYKNWAKYSTEADGTTIYNNGLGYKNGYRVRSGGAEGTSSTTVCTGFIPYKADDTMLIYSPDIGNSPSVSYINAYDSDKNNLGQVATNATYGMFAVSGSSWAKFVTEANKVKTLIIPSSFTGAGNIAFVRISLGFQQSAKAKGESMIITVNEEIT
jgi:hypothetical protein